MIDAIAEAARYWLRRELEAAGLAGQLTPRVLNPRAQGWLTGFVEGAAEALALDPARRHELEARVFVSLFEGTPMGEQLGLEALQMSRLFQRTPGTRKMVPDWDGHVAAGRQTGQHFAALVQGLEAFGQTLR